MARRAVPFALLLTIPCLAAQPSLNDILSRVAEEADVLAQNIPKTLTQETLEQHALLPPSRFKPRAGTTVIASGAPMRWQVREIVSEYTVGTLSEGKNLLEFREVTSVDGRATQSAESAKRALYAGLRSPDDRIRRRMIEDFAQHGLVDIATDYAMMLLAFSKRGLPQMKITASGEARMGSDDMVLLAWQQTSAAGGQLEFTGKKVTRRALQGTLWVRKADGLPLRIQAFAEGIEAKRVIRDEATIEYMASPHGFLTPASVVHRHVVDGNVLTENRYTYEPFKLFSADTEIKFTEIPDPATLPSTPPPPAKKQ